ncbi:MAG TPA: hypothetical protein VM715_01240, partial [Candidatus Acidoferrum sp.]|nr:hypothetical protein [Candidatus Acidoferrum sp.]
INPSAAASTLALLELRRGAYLWTQRQRSCEKIGFQRPDHVLGRAEEMSPTLPNSTKGLDGT